MKISAHKNEIKPLVTGAICFLFMVIMLACGMRWDDGRVEADPEIVAGFFADLDAVASLHIN